MTTESRQITNGPGIFDLLVSLGHETKNTSHLGGSACQHPVVFYIEVAACSNPVHPNYAGHDVLVYITSIRRQRKDLTHNWDIEGYVPNIYEPDKEKLVKIEYSPATRTGTMTAEVE